MLGRQSEDDLKLFGDLTAILIRILHRPNTLVLPYDPSFLPEANLPGLNFDFNFEFSDGPSQLGTLLNKSPPNSHHSSNSRISVHLELGSDDIIHDGEAVDADESHGSANRGIFGQATREDVGDEEGILLQPDFEFDETGTIVEFDSTHLSPRKRPRISGDNNEEWVPPAGQDGDAMDLTEDMPVVHDEALMDLDIQDALAEGTTHGPAEETTHAEDVVAEGEDIEPVRQRTRQRTKTVKNIDSDESTTLRNSDLARWNNEYVSNMALAKKQKQHNKQQTLTKKNAKYFVFGQGIGSVGRGLGSLHEDHPLKQFSGDALYNTFLSKPNPTTEAEVLVQANDSPQTSPQQGRQFQGLDSIDVEFGRHAPSSVLDEHSSQMPWNITASARSSRHSRIGSLSELSARFGETSLGGRLPFPKNRRGRLTSASPLAGRSYLSLEDFEGQETGDMLDEELEITRYLEGELAEDNEGIQALSRRTSAIQRVTGQLDQESLNFFEFIQTHVRSRLDEEDGAGILGFSELLPPSSTSKAVVTQGFMNVLTLATKGLLVVKQEISRDVGENRGSGFGYGEIFMRL